MPPAANGRRTRHVAPLVEDVELPFGDADGAEDVPPALAAKPARTRRADLRRVQEATADQKTRVPREKRAVEVADGELVAPIAGRYFRLSDSIGLMPLMEFAAAADEIDAGNQAQLRGFFRVLKDLVHPEEWDEFRAHTRESKCNDEAFVGFQNAAIEAITARPTKAPEAS